MKKMTLFIFLTLTQSNNISFAVCLDTFQGDFVQLQNEGKSAKRINVLRTFIERMKTWRGAVYTVEEQHLRRERARLDYFHQRFDNGIDHVVAIMRPIIDRVEFSVMHILAAESLIKKMSSETNKKRISELQKKIKRLSVILGKNISLYTMYIEWLQENGIDYTGKMGITTFDTTFPITAKGNQNEKQDGIKVNLELVQSTFERLPDAQVAQYTSKFFSELKRFSVVLVLSATGADKVAEYAASILKTHKWPLVNQFSSLNFTRLVKDAIAWNTHYPILDAINDLKEKGVEIPKEVKDGAETLATEKKEINVQENFIASLYDYLAEETAIHTKSNDLLVSFFRRLDFTDFHQDLIDYARKKENPTFAVQLEKAKKDADELGPISPSTSIDDFNGVLVVSAATAYSLAETWNFVASHLPSTSTVVTGN